jgi:hypothetical protein
MQSLLERIREDFESGGKLGMRSTTRVLVLLQEMIERIEKLERDDARIPQESVTETK